mmetsp:Transcript_8254/g.13765  ORF Transcript_8254/g.13765 Transcript_8254/m.13765 type:complete len:89 (+) Transcript_8254:763-1029(+)
MPLDEVEALNKTFISFNSSKSAEPLANCVMLLICPVCNRACLLSGAMPLSMHSELLSAARQHEKPQAKIAKDIVEISRLPKAADMLDI